MITYHFPPMTTSGMFRSFQFARYLPRFGWAPTVLTTRPETIRDPGVLDDEPINRLPVATRIYRTRVTEPLQDALRIRDRLRRNGSPLPHPSDTAGAEPVTPTWRDWVSDLLSFPDRQAGWIPAAVGRALRLIESERFDAVYSSSPPASAHVAALLVSLYGSLPWIADFRDPWVGNSFTPVRQTPLLDPAERRLEKAVVRRADKVILNTDEMRDHFLHRYAHHGRGTFVALPNGYDPEETIPVPAPSGARKRPFTITHAGTLYGQRDPSALIEAVRLLLERGEISEDELRITFLGSTVENASWSALLERSPLDRIVRLEAKVARAEALRALAESDLLLLIQTGTALQVPRKLFEYVAIGKPILALTDPGATENLIRRERFGWTVRPDDPEPVAAALIEAIRGADPIRPLRPERFDFQNLTGRLRDLLDEVVR